MSFCVKSFAISFFLFSLEREGEKKKERRALVVLYCYCVCDEIWKDFYTKNVKIGVAMRWTLKFLFRYYFFVLFVMDES